MSAGRSSPKVGRLHGVAIGVNGVSRPTTGGVDTVGDAEAVNTSSVTVIHRETVRETGICHVREGDSDTPRRPSVIR